MQTEHKLLFPSSILHKPTFYEEWDKNALPVRLLNVKYFETYQFLTANEVNRSRNIKAVVDSTDVLLQDTDGLHAS